MSVTDRSPEKALAFCTVLMDTGNIGKACAAVGIGRGAARSWYEQDPEFKEQWDRAKELSVEMLEDEVVRRAGPDGVDEAVFHKGVAVGTVRKHSDLLIMFKLKAERPEKYRDRYELTGGGGLPLIPSQLGHIEIARRVLHILANQAEKREIDVTPESHAEA